MKDLISNYYRKMVVNYSVIPTGILLMVLLVSLVGMDRLMSSRQDELIFQRNLSLAEQVVDNFFQVTKLIATSGHGVTAMRFGDYQGFQSVVLPWIQSEPRIRSYVLYNKMGQPVLSWPRKIKFGDSKKAVNDLKNQALWATGENIFLKHSIRENGRFYGWLVIRSDLKSLGLSQMNVRTDADDRSCRALQRWPTLAVCKSADQSMFSFQHTIVFIILSALGLAGLFIILSRALAARLVEPVAALHKGLDLHRIGQTPVWDEILPEDSLSIFSPIANDFSQTLSQVNRLHGELLLREKMGELARQVAHDIRSPLSALNIVVSTMAHHLPEETRSLVKNAVKRIQDVANNVLEVGKKFDIELKKNNAIVIQQKNKMLEEPAHQDILSNPSVHHLCQIVEEVMSEKRTQFVLRSDVEIESVLETGYGMFVYALDSELKCLLSNILNNSIEALPGGGRVVVTLLPGVNECIIKIQDNGIGIPNDILPKLGHEKLSYGKSGGPGTESGSGLGLYSARQSLIKMGGRLEIFSTPSQGTEVRVTLPRSAAPGWFVPNLKLNDGALVVCLDDDRGIHQLWAIRLSEQASRSVQLKTFSTTQGFERWFTAFPRQEPSLFLVDYEFIGEHQNGIDLILKYGVLDRAILITNRFYDADFQNVILRSGCKVIPKNLAYCVPIEIYPSPGKLKEVFGEPNLI